MPTFDQEEFIAFLVRAKRATYASAGGEMIVAAILPESHQLEYAEGPFLYRDVYYGQVFFAGQETVFYDGQPVWSMVYAGGMLTNPPLLGGFQRRGRYRRSVPIAGRRAITKASMRTPTRVTDRWRGSGASR
jgi:hypothetical protein